MNYDVAPSKNSLFYKVPFVWQRVEDLILDIKSESGKKIRIASVVEVASLEDVLYLDAEGVANKKAVATLLAFSPKNESHKFFVVDETEFILVKEEHFFVSLLQSPEDQIDIYEEHLVFV
ncbi:MAG: hypothetical protein ACK5N8_02945 [Alphaproteobacteria bacterium]